MTKFVFSLICFCSLLGWTSAQQSCIGVWKTIDDETGKEKSHVEIKEYQGKYYATVTQLLDKPADTKCSKCSGDLHNKPVLGMIVMWDMHQENATFWTGGRVLDPNKGSDYACSIWFENGDFSKLKVRGKHWTGIYRTQVWYRVQ